MYGHWSWPIREQPKNEKKKISCKFPIDEKSYKEKENMYRTQQTGSPPKKEKGKRESIGTLNRIMATEGIVDACGPNGKFTSECLTCTTACLYASCNVNDVDDTRNHHRRHHHRTTTTTTKNTSSTFVSDVSVFVPKYTTVASVVTVRTFTVAATLDCSCLPSKCVTSVTVNYLKYWRCVA